MYSEKKEHKSIDFEEIGKNILTSTIQQIKERCTYFNIKNLEEETFLETLTYYTINNARKYKSPIVTTAAKKELREYLKKYTPYKLEQEEIINFYYKRAEERKKIDNAKLQLDSLLSDLSLLVDFDIKNISDLSKLDISIEKLHEIRDMLNIESEIEILDSGEVVKDNLKYGFQIDGILSKMESLDTLIGGLRNQEMIVVAGRPGTGKTAIMCTFVSNISKKHKIGIFSAEMSAKMIVNRVLSCETGIDSAKLLKIKQDKYSFLKVEEREILAIKAENLTTRTIKIVDCPNINIDILVRKAIQMKKDFFIEILFIDYLQLLQCSLKENRVEQLTYISRTIKGLARTLDIPVVVLAQLNRDAEEKAPNQRNLKGSGAIEEDADVILLLYGNEIIVEKNRNGKTGFINIIYNKEISRFTEPCIFYD